MASKLIHSAIIVSSYYIITYLYSSWIFAELYGHGAKYSGSRPIYLYPFYHCRLCGKSSGHPDSGGPWLRNSSRPRVLKFWKFENFGMLLLLKSPPFFENASPFLIPQIIPFKDWIGILHFCLIVSECNFLQMISFKSGVVWRRNSAISPDHHLHLFHIQKR